MTTLKDIAQASLVSTSTVSKILGRSPELSRISQRTINKVRKVAEELGYQPNANARALVQQKSMTIGVYMASHAGPKINETYASPILEGISHQAYENGYDMMLINFGISDSTLKSCEDKLRSRRVDGVIVIYANDDDLALESLVAMGKPVVAVDYFRQDQSVTSINVDNAAAIQLVVEYLHRLGHRQISFLGELCQNRAQDHQLRSDTFASVCSGLGIAVDSCIVETGRVDCEVSREEGNYCFKDGYVGTDWLLRNGKAFTALACYNDWVALGAMKRLAEEGLRVPRDVSVVGFDNNSYAECTVPALTTVSHPVAEMGREAVKHILDAVGQSSGKPAARTIMFKPELVIRESCAAPRVEK